MDVVAGLAGELSDLARPGNVLLLGETHGTNEFPRLVGELAALAAARVRVLVGLEIPPGSVIPADLASSLFAVHRDAAMATTLESALARHPGAWCVVLAGNVHTRITRLARLPDPHLGQLLVSRHEHVLALDGHTSGGSLRAAISSRGAEVMEVAPHPTPPGSTGRYGKSKQRSRGHHGWFNVGPVTPSLPLR
jgi:hypothetical protein